MILICGSEQRRSDDPTTRDELHDLDKDAAACELATCAGGLRVERRAVDSAMRVDMNHSLPASATACAGNGDVIFVVADPGQDGNAKAVAE